MRPATVSGMPGMPCKEQANEMMAECTCSFPFVFMEDFQIVLWSELKCRDLQ